MKPTLRMNSFIKSLGAPIFIGAFFCFLFLCFPLGIYPDTASYVNMAVDREPLYPLLLWITRSIFGEHGQVVMAFMQNCFAGIVTFYLYRFLKQKFGLSILYSIGVLVGLLIPHIITPLGSASHMVLTNSILSEGITFSMYTLFFLFLFVGLWGKNNENTSNPKYMYLSLLLALFMSVTRSQMMVSLIVWLLVFSAKAIADRKGKRIVLLVILFLLAFFVKGTCIKTYNYVVNGSYMGNTSGNLTILTNVLYSSDLSTNVDLGNEKLQVVYEEIRTGLMDQRLNVAYADPGIMGEISYHEYCHDRIKYEVIDLPLYYYVKQQGFTNTNEIKQNVDKVAMELVKELLPDNWTTYARTYVYVALGGLIRTVGILHPIMNWYALFIYAFTLAILLFLLKNTVKESTINRSVAFTMIVLLMILGNVSATALMIMCLSRYMIYNTAFFYIALLLLMRECINRKNIKKGIRKNRL